jgi:hypothetical protein
MELDREAAEEEARWNALTTKEKIGDWATRHQYSIILGSWALSMAVAGAIVSRDRFVTSLRRRFFHVSDTNMRVRADIRQYLKKLFKCECGHKA